MTLFALLVAFGSLSGVATLAFFGAYWYEYWYNSPVQLGGEQMLAVDCDLGKVSEKTGLDQGAVNDGL